MTEKVEKEFITTCRLACVCIVLITVVEIGCSVLGLFIGCQ